MKFSHTVEILVISFFLVGLVLLITPFQSVEAAWKNLCPEQTLCPALHRGTINLRLVGINESPGKIIGGVALPYRNISLAKGIPSLLSYSDRTELPQYDQQEAVQHRPVMQHSDGNWVVGKNGITVFDSAGKKISTIDLSIPSPDPLIPSVYSYNPDSIHEKNGNLFFVRSYGGPSGTTSFFVSRDAGISWDGRAISVALSTERGLFDNAFGKGFFVVGQNKPFPPEPLGPVGLYSIPEDLDMITDWAPATRVDDLKPITSFNATLNSIALDLGTINTNEKIIYGATNKGLFISRDAGRSWSPVNTMTEPLSSVAIVHDHEPKILLVTTADRVLASRDNGVTWTPFELGLYSGESRVYYTQGQLLIRAQNGWHRCNDLECDGQASALPPAYEIGNKIRVVEFYHAELDHYFITSNQEEIIGIDNGSAGSGWVRTAHEFSVWTPLGHPDRVGKSVCRFYGSTTPGPNSHFFSIRPDECEWLHTLQKQTPDDQPRWNFESLVFEVEAVSPIGFCRSGRIPVFRAYNNGHILGKDSNHRFVPDRAEIDKLVASGWIDEGIAFCAVK